MQTGMTQIGTSRGGRRKERGKGSSSRPWVKSVDTIMQEKWDPKPGNMLCFVPGMQMFYQISLLEEYRKFEVERGA